MEPTSAMALASLGNGVLSGLGSAFGASKSAKSAKKAAQMQIAWEMMRAKNAHQWEIQDLKKAGLNPVLSANGGAQTGSINPPMPDTSGYGQIGQGLANSINSAASIMNQNKQTEIAKDVGDSTSAKNYADAAKSMETAKNIPEYLKVEQMNAATAKAAQLAQERHMEYENNLLNQQTTYQTIENALKEIEKEVNTGTYGTALAYVDRLLQTIKSAGGAASSFVPTIAMWKGATTGTQLLTEIKSFKNSIAYKMLQKSYRK